MTQVRRTLDADARQGQGVVGRAHRDELDRIEGKKDQLAGALQVKYGYTKDQAEEEIDRRMNENQAA